MNNLHGLPKIYGMILIIFGMIFFIPLVGFISVLVDDLTNGNKWSVLMFGLTLLAISASILMIGFGTNIVWYHDKKDDDKTFDEKIKNSKFKPVEDEK